MIKKLLANSPKFVLAYTIHKISSPVAVPVNLALISLGFKVLKLKL
jgi:hypothetical protein